MSSEIFHFHVGALSCIALLDAIDRATEDDIPNMFTDNTDRMLAAFRAMSIPYITFCQNILLVQTGDKRILIDSGIGQVNPEAPGQLPDRLRAEGVTPESIDTVVISHYHPDHIGGLLDAAGNPTFPTARLVVPSREHDYWMSEDVLASLEPDNAAWFGQIFAAYAGRLVLMDETAEIEPGIRYVPALGHTPGHQAVQIESEGARLLHIVDTIHLPFQFSTLDLDSPFDSQPEIAAVTRRALLAQAASDNLLLMAYHFPFPGLGYVRQRGDQLTWEPYVPAPEA